ncbi:beta/gamma crystallin domain-containing protein [Nocardia sp. NPDC101769]|uniref:beta/gamma crystallin domain-containing protein n=1 Tax=Nocardia sp. NPDC101769 TaxID=3364333 RepID=UPI0037F7ED06
MEVDDCGPSALAEASGQRDTGWWCSEGDRSAATNPPLPEPFHTEGVIMTTSLQPNQATFFTRAHYQGESYTYSTDDGVVEALGELNDKFKSVRLGSDAKVLAWQHYGFGGHYAVWETDQPDISGFGGLSVFKVEYRSTQLIMARFVNATHPDRTLAMKVNTAGSDPGLTERWLAQNDPNFTPIALAFADGRAVTTALYVRDQDTFLFDPTGSCYFRWNATSNEVTLDPGPHFPPGMNHKQASANEFIFEL